MGCPLGRSTPLRVKGGRVNPLQLFSYYKSGHKKEKQNRYKQIHLTRM